MQQIDTQLLGKTFFFADIMQTFLTFPNSDMYF